MAWYNTYRPKNFDEVFGQELVKSVLQNAIKKQTIKHAYLFSGPKGVGKTTLARIFANNLNQTDKNPEAGLDIIEMDAASHTGVDDIRQLIESAKTQPISGHYKIFIIDEVHMLSKSAMNALLKILEEPPEYLIFLLATTNEEKLLPTVLSRLTKLRLFNHTTEDIVKKLEQIAQAEKMNIDETALKLIARRSGGSQRDAINLLETVSSYDLDKYDENNTGQLLGLLPQELLEKTIQHLLSETGINPDLISEIEGQGVDGQGFLTQLLEFLLDRTLNGDKHYDALIIPIAEILDLQLPLTTPLSTLALVQVKLSEAEPVKKKSEELNSSLSGSPETQSNRVSQEGWSKKSTGVDLKHEESKPTTENTNSTEVGLNEQSVTQSNSKKISDIDTPNKDKEFITPSQEDASDTSEDDDNSTHSPHPSAFIPQTSDKQEPATTEQPTPSKEKIDLAEFLKKLMHLPDTPPTLKMMGQDLGGELKGDKLLITTSNNMFLAGLKSPKIQDWILHQYQQKFGSRPKLDLEIRADSKPSITAAELPEKKPADKLQPTVSDKVNAAALAKTEFAESGIFYKVYNRLPKNMEDKGVKVRTGPLPAPQEKIKDWDDHAKELFEFE